MPATWTELYRSRPVAIERDKIAIRVIVQLPIAELTTGVDGWIGASSKVLPVVGAKLSAVITADPVFTWTTGLFVEPTLEKMELDPRYRVGFALFDMTFVGARKWAS